MRLYANPHTYRARPCSKPAAEARGARHRAGAEGSGRAARAPHTPSIADGTALHRGRGGSRHFQRVEFRLGGLCLYAADTLLFCLLNKSRECNEHLIEENV